MLFLTTKIELIFLKGIHVNKKLTFRLFKNFFVEEFTLLRNIFGETLGFKFMAII